MVIFSVVCTAVAALGLVHRLVRCRSMLPLYVAGMVWAGIFTASMLIVVKYLQLPATYQSFLSLWELEERSVPLWVGEFGTYPWDTSQEWKTLLG